MSRSSPAPLWSKNRTRKQPMAAPPDSGGQANRILCIGATPAAQRVMVFPKLQLGQVNRAVTTLEGAAGKSINVAKVLKALGAEPIAAGFLGGERGKQLRQILAARAIELAFVCVSVPTRLCITVINESAGTITELVEESRPVKPGDYEKLLKIVRRNIAGCAAVVMSGSLTPGGPVDFYARCTELARRSGVLSVVDAQGPVLVEALCAQPDLVKPNRVELATTVGRKLGTESEVLEAFRELCGRGARNVVVTAGAAPTLAFDGRRLWRIPSLRVKVVNPIGSGDAFTAALAWRLTKGDDLGQACRWGTAAGATNALSLLPGELDAREVSRLLQHTKV